MRAEVKICGVTTQDVAAAAAEGGARYVGFVFYPASPRNLTAAAAAALARAVPDRLTIVGLFVDPDDATIEKIIAKVPLDLLQLHGSETPERVSHVKRKTGLPVMKAIKLAVKADLAAATPYLGVADRLLFDAKPPTGSSLLLPGGNALAFDWRLLAGSRFPCPWMLSGGLDPDNVAEAIYTSGAPAVDVSSGVEARRGVKDPEKIAAFIAAAAGAGG